MISVWLIEDNAAFREVACLTLGLHEQKFKLATFQCCEDALDRLKQIEQPDVILLDVELPGMNGIEGLRHFKRVIPEVTLIILTVFEDEEKIFNAICAGASGYLLKSESLENISTFIEQALEGGAPINPRIARKVLGMFSKLKPIKEDYGLSSREQQIIEMMVEGLAKKEIAARLSLSAHTVSNYIRVIYRKLHVNCQTAAVSVAVRDGIVNP